jgi:hypothetical protein
MLTGLAFGLLGEYVEATPNPAAPPPTRAEQRIVYLARDLSDENLIALGANLNASGQNAVLLIESEKLAGYTKALLSQYKPTQVIPVGSFPNGRNELERRLEMQTAAVVPWSRQAPVPLCRTLFPAADDLVICPAKPRGQLLQAACLAGVLRVPLCVVAEECSEVPASVREMVEAFKPRHAYLVGNTNALSPGLAGIKKSHVADEEVLARMVVRRLAEEAPIETLVIANPEDDRAELGGTAALAPWISIQKHAPLLLTNAEGNNANALVEKAVKLPSLKHVENLLFVANLKAIPMQERPNPIPGDKDATIEMEPLTPKDTTPFSFAVGRLFHEDFAVLPLLLARQRLLLSQPPRARRVIVASNPGNSLPLLEAFSRNTVHEFRNAGYTTSTMFGKDVKADELRKQLTDSDIFLWEGHHNTLIRDWSFPSWDEPLPPSLVFLQSCLALKDYKVHPQLARGAVAVVGSSTRTYSASGGACSLAFFDALLYDGQTLGGALRQSKNFLLAYARLKEKRLGKEAVRSGANLRSAWAFTLWGDPTLKLPAPPAPEEARPTVRHQVVGNTIHIEVPAEKHDKVITVKGDSTTPSYQVRMPANARLAGLLRKTKDEDGQPLVPFLFAEVHLPRAKLGLTPILRSRLPESSWVFNWDERRRTGYLLLLPGLKEPREIRFHVEWSQRSEEEARRDGTEQPRRVKPEILHEPALAMP